MALLSHTSDDLPLEEGEDFIGTNKPIILCINNSYIAKGAYVCKMARYASLALGMLCIHSA